MKRIHPRALMAALGDLQESCTEWLIEGREALARSENIQHRENQHAQTIARRAAITLTHAQDDRDHVRRVRGEVEGWLLQCHATQNKCNDLLRIAQEKKITAQETLAYWQEKLLDAEAWLQWALQRLAQAQEELEAAQADFERAQWEYNAARDRYNSCVRSQEKRNCGSLRSAVSRAENRLEAANYRLQLAYNEYQAAKLEVEAAHDRVDCCKISVNRSQQALSIAVNVVERAEQAVVEAERSLDYVNAALKFVVEAVDYVENEVSSAETMVALTHKDIQALNTAAVAHQRADRSFESAQRLIILSRQELDYRIARLADFDRTGLL